MITHCSEQLLRSLASEDTTTKEASSQLRRDAPKYPWTTMLFTVALVVAITTTLGAEANSVAPVVRPTVFVNTAAASSGQQISNASNQNNAVATSSAAPLIQQQPAGKLSDASFEFRWARLRLSPIRSVSIGLNLIGATLIVALCTLHFARRAPSEHTCARAIIFNASVRYCFGR